MTPQADMLQLDLARREVAVSGRPLHLTGSEYAVLELLLLRKGAVLTDEALLNHLHGGRDEPDARIIDVLIMELRKKLTQAGVGDLLATVPGQGYVLRMPEAPSGSTGGETAAGPVVPGTAAFTAGLAEAFRNAAISAVASARGARVGVAGADVNPSNPRRRSLARS
jgi:two-component system cell cycle response regulator CtrA